VEPDSQLASSSVIVQETKIDEQAQAPAEKADPAPESSDPRGMDEAGLQIIHFTRSWIQYGTFGFAIACIVIGAVEAIFGR
jgi:hypothetical protein